ncbi:unnamed protein product [Closterium sp. Naga37s-1]|nr:unnamed protein product [Closterium sp. Naga37s-1]
MDNSTRRETYNPFNGFCGTKASSQNSVIATAPPSLCPLLPACLRAPFRTELLVASSKFDRNPKKRRSEGSMVPRQVSQEEAEQSPPQLTSPRCFSFPSPLSLPPSPARRCAQLHALKAHRFYLLLNHPLAHRCLAEHSKPLRPKFWLLLSLALISSSDPSHTPRPRSAPLASPSPTSPHVPAALPALATAPPPRVTNARELYSHVKAYLSGRAGGNDSGGDGGGEGSGDGSGEEEVHCVWRVVRSCGVESAEGLSGVVDERGWTTMHVAARNGDSPVALLRMGMPARVCSTRNATTPLHVAAYGSHVGCMRLLVQQHGADIRTRTAGLRWLAQRGIEPAEVEAAGANPKVHLKAHLMERAVQIVREEHGWGDAPGVDGFLVLDDHHGAVPDFLLPLLSG